MTDTDALISLSVPDDWFVTTGSGADDAPVVDALANAVGELAGDAPVVSALVRWALLSAGGRDAQVASFGVIPSDGSDEPIVAVVIGGAAPSNGVPVPHDALAASIGTLIGRDLPVQELSDAVLPTVRVDALASPSGQAEGDPAFFVALYMVQVSEAAIAWLACATPSWRLAPAFLQLFDAIAARVRLQDVDH